MSRPPAGCALGSVGNPFDRVWPPTMSSGIVASGVPTYSPPPIVLHGSCDPCGRPVRTRIGDCNHDARAHCTEAEQAPGETYDKCYETNTPLKPGTKIVSMVRNRSIRGVQIEAHSTFFTTKNESKFVLLTTIFTMNGRVSYYRNYFCTRLEKFRTIETIFVQK